MNVDLLLRDALQLAEVMHGKRRGSGIETPVRQTVRLLQAHDGQELRYVARVLMGQLSAGQQLSLSEELDRQDVQWRQP